MRVLGRVKGFDKELHINLEEPDFLDRITKIFVQIYNAGFSKYPLSLAVLLANKLMIQNGRGIMFLPSGSVELMRNVINAYNR